MDEHIYPNEEAYAHQLKTAENRFAPLPLMDELKLKAKEAGSVSYTHLTLPTTLVV